MKFFVFFFLCFVALAAAAPQFVTTWPGVVAPGVVAPGVVAPGVVAPVVGTRTVVAGPTVVNGFDGVSRFVAPGYVGVY